MPINDGEDIIFANTEIDDDTKHSRLLKLFLKSESFYDEMFPALSEAMKYFKDTERGHDAVSEVTKEWEREGYEKGYAAAIKEQKELIEKEKSRAETEKIRADVEKIRADTAESEIQKLKKLLEENNISI